MRIVEMPLVVEPRRVESVDALRGFSMFFIIGGDSALIALGRMSEGKGPVIAGIGGFLSEQVTHVSWQGLHFYDFIFPLFIFIIGVSIVLSLGRQVERDGQLTAHLHVLRRAALLYGLGLIYYGGISQHWDDIRYVGVLQRIAACYLFTSLLFLHLDWRGLVVALIALVGGYWALMTFVPVPGVGAGLYGPDSNLANWIDANYLPGRLWNQSRDPEGLLSTLPAIGTCVIGVLAGMVLKDQRLSHRQMSLWLIGGGAVLLAAGYLWSLEVPVIKALWTSSFTLITGGYSVILLGITHEVVDVWGWRRWTVPFVWIGANAITLYFVNGVVGFSPFAARFIGGDFALWIDTWTTPGTGGFLVQVLGLAFALLLAAYLYRRHIFLRV